MAMVLANMFVSMGLDCLGKETDHQRGREGAVRYDALAVAAHGWGFALQERMGYEARNIFARKVVAWRERTRSRSSSLLISKLRTEKCGKRAI